MISENREFSKKKGVALVSVVGEKKSFYTNSGDELEGAVPRFS